MVVRKTNVVFFFSNPCLLHDQILRKNLRCKCHKHSPHTLRSLTLDVTLVRMRRLVVIRARERTRACVPPTASPSGAAAGAAGVAANGASAGAGAACAGARPRRVALRKCNFPLSEFALKTL